ncbi:MAG: hypothetical protein L3K52_15225 [Candidatus Thiothrix sulfatifontis]|nr:MAG: hypothetical protein L3K52_15225 [Candidatus Thiothrix sulfatifontis]
MTAITMGNTARTLSAYLPHLPIALPKAGKKRTPITDLVYESTQTGLIVYQDNIPVAWVYPGYHKGQIANQPATCNFVDVAFHRRTEHGVNLETHDFLTLQEALDFVRTTFGGGVQ